MKVARSITFSFALLCFNEIQSASLALHTDEVHSSHHASYLHGDGIDTPANGHANRRLDISTEAITLTDPCLIIVQRITRRDGSEKERPLCLLQGSDRHNFGPVSLTIDGLTMEWMKQRGIQPTVAKQRTLYLKHMVVNLDTYALELPDGKSIDDMVLDLASAGTHIDAIDAVDTIGGRASDAAPEGAIVGNRRLQNSRRPRTDELMVGEKKFLIIRAIMNDGANVPRQDIVDNMLNASPSFIDQFKAVSFGKFTFSPAQVDGAADGILDVNVDRAQDVTAVMIMNDIVAYLDQTISSAITIDNYLLVLPYGSSDDGKKSWYAFAILPGDVSVFNIDGPNTSFSAAYDTMTVLHEIGHNYLLQHSNENDREYDDTSSVMGQHTWTGIGESLVYDALKGFNGAKSWQLGWYADQAIELVAGPQIDFTTRLCGVVDYDPTDPSFHVIVRITDPETILNYFVAFNRASGFNAQTAEGRDMVLLTSADDVYDSYANDDFSNLEAKIDSGGQHVIREPGTQLNGIAVTVLAIDPMPASPMCATVNIFRDINAPTSGCTNWRNAVAATNYFADEVKSFRFDIEVYQSIEVQGIQLVVPGTSSQPYVVWYRRGTWDADGGWTRIASGNIDGEGGEAFTSLIEFDELLELSATDGTVALRIDTDSRLTNWVQTEPIVHPDDIVTCSDDCAIAVRYGRSSSVAGDRPDSIRPNQYDAFIGSIWFCSANSQAPTMSSPPSTSVQPTSTCEGWANTFFPPQYFVEMMSSFRFDVAIRQDVDIIGMHLVLLGTSELPYTIWYRRGTWDAAGGWTLLASGDIRGRTRIEYTELIPFDRPLELSASDGIVSLRVDVSNNVPTDIVNSIQPHPEDAYGCANNCPLQIFAGLPSPTAGNRPAGFQSNLFTFFTGTLSYCNPASRSPSSVPTASPSRVPSPAPTQGPTAVPTRLSSFQPSLSMNPSGSGTREPSSSPTPAPTVTPTEVPTVLPTVVPKVIPTEVPTVVPTLTPTSPSVSSPTQVAEGTPTTGPTVLPAISSTPGPTRVSVAESTSGPTPASTAVRAVQGVSLWKLSGTMIVGLVMVAVNLGLVVA